jgi:hypothetical protein
MAVVDLKFLSERTPRSGQLLNDMMNPGQSPVQRDSPVQLDSLAPPPVQPQLPDALMNFFRGILQPGVTSGDVLSTLAQTRKRIGKPGEPGFPEKLTDF